MKTQTAGIGRGNFFLAVISGIVLTSGFPKIGFSWGAWAGLTLLLFAIRNVSVRSSILLGMLTGMVHFGTLLYWLIGTMHLYGYLPLWLSLVIFILLTFYLSFYVALFSGLVRQLRAGPVISLFLIPAVWVCLEYLRSYALTGFPWGLIGYTQYRHLYLIQFADIFGVYGVSFVVVLINAVLFFGFLFLKKEKWQARFIRGSHMAASLAVTVCVLILVLGYGIVRLKSVDDMTAHSLKKHVAVIQGNIEQAAKWDLKFRTDTIDTYIRLSKQANQTTPDLIVWPETATPFYFKYNIELTGVVLQSIADMKTYFVVGSPTVEVNDQQENYYNSAYLISPVGDIMGRNDKVHLVPFGEYVPLKKFLPFIHHLVAQVGEFNTGKTGDTLKWPQADIGVLICYEIIFPELARAVTASNAGLLVNITNDAWFGKTSAPYQHFSMAVFRAIENRRSLIRAANTGISGFIDPAGRVLQKSGLFVEDAFTCEIPVIDNYRTVYNRYGNLSVVGCFIALALIIMVHLLFLKKQTGRHQSV